MDIEDWELDEMVTEAAGEEVGRLFKRGGRKRRRRILGALFGGPAAWIGMAAKRRRRRNQARRALQGPRVPESRPRSITAGEDRVQPFGFGTVTVAAGDTVQRVQRVQKAFQPTRLILSSPDPLSNFQIEDIKIGTSSQLAGLGGVPASAFDALAEDASIVFAPAQTGIDISVEIRNLDGANPHDLSAMFYGVAAQFG